ncbi:MAG: aspartate aminotransferase family protein [Candidatus Kapaibacteriales bacterium]
MNPILRQEQDYILQTYGRLPLIPENAEGMYVYTKDGKKYLDMLGGIAVNVLGHSDKETIEVIKSQSQKYLHLSNYFYQEPQIGLAEDLCRISGLDKVFYGNSGTETTDGSLKLARKWGAERGKHKIISFKGAFHGRSYGALSMMDKPNFKDNMGPFMNGFDIIPFNDPIELEHAINNNTAAVFFESIQGEGGLSMLSQEVAEKLKELKNEFDFLLAADEVQSGIGRTGKFSAYEHLEIEPEIVWIAKGLGGGLPLGAILVSKKLESVFNKGQHGTTFGGNALSCAVGQVVINRLENGLMDHVQSISAYLEAVLESIVKSYPELCVEVRGKGLMTGIELTFEARKLVNLLLEFGIIANSTSANVLRLVPPLIIEKAHIEEFDYGLRKALDKYSEVLP